MKKFKENLNKAFTEMNNKGIFAKQNWTCCQSCGSAEIPDNIKSYCFYHAQDKQDLNEGNNFYLTYSDKKTAKKVIAILKAFKIKTKWDNDIKSRIEVINKGGIK